VPAPAPVRAGGAAVARGCGQANPSPRDVALPLAFRGIVTGGVLRLCLLAPPPTPAAPHPHPPPPTPTPPLPLLLPAHRAPLQLFEPCRGGELFDSISNRQFSFTEPQASCIMRRLLLALKVMHDAGLVHRDIKPENVLLTGAGIDSEIKVQGARDVLHCGARALLGRAHVCPPPPPLPLTSTTGGWCAVLHFAAPPPPPSSGAVSFATPPPPPPCAFWTIPLTPAAH
jgi:hypothetical protein